MKPKQQEKPQFAHYCNACIFLGSVEIQEDNGYGVHFDLWWCADQRKKEGQSDRSSVICRHADDGPEYFSSHPPECFADPEGYIEMMDKREHPYAFAMARAAAMGLYTGPYADRFKDVRAGRMGGAR